MEATATAATTHAPAPFALHHTLTRRGPASAHPARAIRAPHVLVSTKQAGFLWRPAEGMHGGNNVNSRASTLLAGCCPGTDAGESRSSSTVNSGATSPPPLPLPVEEDLQSLGTVEPNAPASQAPELAAAGEGLPRQVPPPSNEGLVFGLGAVSAWDGREVGSPVVKRYIGDDKERWFMWYHGSADGGGDNDSIGLAVSANGIHWERGAGPVESVDGAGIVMRRSNDWWAFDTISLRPADVLIMSNDKVRTPGAVYWLYYTGFSSEEVSIPSAPAPTTAPRSLPGLAISQDGRHWARIEGEHHSGALLDVGAPGEWDSLSLAAPRVVYHGRGDLRMYYHSFDPSVGRFAVGIARSRDGIRWVKLGRALGEGPAGCFDEGGVLNGHVVRSAAATGEKGGYVMAYEGVSADGRSSIGLAESPDGLKNWRRCGGGGAILKPSGEGGWDDGGVGSPCLVQMDGEEGWRLYYRGVDKGGRTGIGLALSHGGSDVAGGFRRWTGFCSLK